MKSVGCLPSSGLDLQKDMKFQEIGKGKKSFPTYSTSIFLPAATCLKAQTNKPKKKPQNPERNYFNEYEKISPNIMILPYVPTFMYISAVK